MVRASVVYTILVLGFFALVIFSNQPRKIHSRRHNPGGRRLIVRNTFPAKSEKNSSQHHENVAFDPVVADLEWRRENRDWERSYFQEQYRTWNESAYSSQNQHQDHQNPHEHHHDPHEHHYDHAPGLEEQPVPEYGEDSEDPEEYLNDESHFNITHRLEVLFPQLDVNPKDGFVSLSELQDWHVLQAEKLSMQRTEREFEVRDKNHDGLISIQEYLPHLTEEQLVNASTEHGEAGWWKEHFDLADADGNGGLNRTEFNDFLHPEDSHNPKLHQWLRKEQIRENDNDKDGKLSLDEFDHIFDMLRYYGEDLSHLHQGNDEALRKAMFTELDKNKDGFLTEDELETIMGKLNPGEKFYARQQAQYLIEQADENKDGRLSLQEMLEHPYVFYSTAVTPEEYPSDHYHDEFR